MVMTMMFAQDHLTGLESKTRRHIICRHPSDKALNQWISLRPGRPCTNDRDDMGSATSSGGNNSRFPIKQRNRIDAASDWTTMINFILHR